MKTNLQLVEYAKKALTEKWGYVWGTYGKTLTTQGYNDLLKQYPKQVGNYAAYIQQQYIGKKTVDCSGLIKSFMWSENENVTYDLNTDISANMFFKFANRVGTIESIPNIPGLLVWMNDHIGIYIGNGRVIEAKGTKYGVIESPLKGQGANSWTHWLECSYITYVKRTYKEIIKEASAGQGDQWIIAIDNIVRESEMNQSNELKKILKYLPLLIEKIAER